MSYKIRQALTALLIVLILFTLAFIWGNSLLDREQSTEVSTGLLDFLSPLLEALGLKSEDDYFLRKLAHFDEFAVLGMELSFLLILRKRSQLKHFLVSVLLCLVVAVIDESIQFFSGRACQLSDVMLDFSGSLVAIFLVWFFTHIYLEPRN